MPTIWRRESIGPIVGSIIERNGSDVHENEFKLGATSGGQMPSKIITQIGAQFLLVRVRPFAERVIPSKKGGLLGANSQIKFNLIFSLAIPDVLYPVKQ